MQAMKPLLQISVLVRVVRLHPSPQVAGHYFIAGFGDGAVRAYDTRLDARNPLVRAWKQHKSWIVNVHMQRGGIRELVTGSIAGEVKLFEYTST
jgi:regulatory associated protein of mTOR